MSTHFGILLTVWNSDHRLFNFQIVLKFQGIDSHGSGVRLIPMRGDLVNDGVLCPRSLRYISEVGSHRLILFQSWLIPNACVSLAGPYDNAY